MKITNTATTRVSLLVAVLTVSGLLFAGTLDPPGPPAPTMVTLQQIYDRLGAAVGKTGQTTCWDAAGNLIACAGTGQDAEFHRGASVTPRFTDNGDGTVNDSLTGLTWLKNANCFSFRTWSQALANANTLASGACSLTDGSTAGDWRLPNVNELMTLTDFGQFNPSLPAGHPFTGVQSFTYWSSTSFFSNRTFIVNFYASILGEGFKTDSSGLVWPVRGGQ